jgi:serine/threonine-protein kinase
VGNLVGTKVGRFRVDRELGRGGMGAVYAAFDERLEREVALKVLLANEANDDDQRRFIREARLAAKLTHPNIASIYEVDQIDGRIVIIMELLDGESLRKILSTRRLTDEQSIAIARDVARALARAHASGVIHRDIKPENVFVTEPAPGALHAKVLDFGLARQRDPAMTMTAGDGNESTMSQTWGTPGYMSPEQAMREAVDPRTDVFAFGALLYEMLAGIRAFRAANELGVLAAVLRSEPRSLSQIVADLPPAVDAIVTRCLKKDRNERFADGKELSGALESFARPLSTGSFRAVERISSPDLGARPSSPHTIESTPSNASVTTTKDPPTKPTGLAALPVDLRDPRIQKRAAIALGALVGLVVILVVVFSRSPSAVAPPPAGSGTLATSPPPVATSTDPDPFVVPPPPPVATESAAAIDADDPPPAASASHGAPSIPVRTVRPSGDKNKPADCKTPFIIDSKGVKIPKLHCLH